MLSHLVPTGRRTWRTWDGRFFVEDHPMVHGLLIRPEDWSLTVVTKIVDAGLGFHAGSLREAEQRLSAIYEALGWEPDMRTV